jgi:alpha-D-ribose 1-methylphosphonate 5-triphosphate synthase subunit PhnG
MAVLARARRAELETIVAGLPEPPRYAILKPAEAGSVMVEARAGGAGRRFNLGEATATRCVVRLQDGTVGYAYALGRDLRKAELAAVLDALLQGNGGEALAERLVRPLAEAQAERRRLASRKAAATRVNFFTLARGD